MSKHTKTPWKVDKELGSHSGEWLIAMDAGDRGRGIAIAETRPGSGNALANAKFIANAANNHEALVSSLGVLLNPDSLPYSKFCKAEQEITDLHSNLSGNGPSVKPEWVSPIELSSEEKARQIIYESLRLDCSLTEWVAIRGGDQISLSDGECRSIASEFPLDWRVIRYAFPSNLSVSDLDLERQITAIQIDSQGAMGAPVSAAQAINIHKAGWRKIK